MNFLAPIVGMHFRPPAQFILADLPFGAELELKRQFDNPYDPNAIQVLLHGFSPEGTHRDLLATYYSQALPDDQEAGRGFWNRSSLTDPLFLGFVSAKTGEAKIVSNYMDERKEISLFGKLTATLEGKPAVVFDMEVPKEKLEAKPEIKPEINDEIPF